MPGRWFSTTAGRFLEYESLLERDWMLLLDFDLDVEWVCEQPLRLRYRKDAKLASHVPDLLVWRAGTPELCDVKSEERLEDPEFLAQVELVCGAREPMFARPVLMHVLWASEALTDLAGPIGEESRVCGRLRVVA